MIIRFFILITLIASGRMSYAQGSEQNLVYTIDTAFVQQLIQDAGLIPGNLFPDSAIAQYEYAASLAKKVNYPRGVVYAYIRIAQYKNEYKIDNAGSQVAIATAIPYLKNLKKSDQYLIPTLYNLMGITKYKLALYDSALYYFKRGLGTMDSLKVVRPGLKAQFFNNIGAVFATTRQYSTGIAYLKKSIAVEGLDSSAYAMHSANLGSIYANLINDMDSATHWWSQATSIYKARQQKERLQNLYTNMSIGWQSLMHQNLKKAAFYLDSAIRIDPLRLNNNHLMLRAAAYLDFYMENYEKAIERALRLTELVWATDGDRYEIKDAYWLLSLGYEHIGNISKARKYQKEYVLLEDSLNSENIQRSINQLEIKYQMADKDRLLAVSNSKLYQQRNWLILSIGGGILLMTFFISYLRNSRQRQKLDAEKIKSLEQNRKIETLNIRMEAEEKERVRISRELHDGMGVLISAAKINYTLLKKQITPDTNYLEPIHADGTEILERMRQEMHHVAHNLVPEYYLTHNGLVPTLDSLIVHFPKSNFHIQVLEFGVRREMHPERGFILFRALEEIITNAVRHSGGSILEIQLVYHDDKMHILAEDDGNGFNINGIQRGIGLESIERRVAQLKGSINLYAEMGKGVSYSLEIPY
jgi:two-component system NarL family sensor kinase